MTPDINIDDLPGVLQDICALIGLHHTMRLVQRYGGVRIYVPKRVEPDHELARLIGLSNAEALSGAFGGEVHFDIPKGELALKAVRNAKIRSLRAEGLSIRNLSLNPEFGRLTERTIRAICGEMEDDRQGGLF